LPTQVAHQRFLCALKAHFVIQNALLMRIKSAGVLPGYLVARIFITTTELLKEYFHPFKTSSQTVLGGS